MYSVIGIDFSENLNVFEVNGIMSGRCTSIDKARTPKERIRNLVMREFSALLSQMDDEEVICFADWNTRFREREQKNGRSYYYGIEHLCDDHPDINIRVLNFSQSLSTDSNGDIIIVNSETRRTISYLGKKGKVIYVTDFPKELSKRAADAIGIERIVNSLPMETILEDKVLTYVSLIESDARKHVLPFYWHQGRLTLGAVKEAMRALGNKEMVVKPANAIQGIGAFYVSSEEVDSEISRKIQKSYMEISIGLLGHMPYSPKWVFQEFDAFGRYNTIRAISLGHALTHSYVRMPYRDVVKAVNETNAPVPVRIMPGLRDVSTRISQALHCHMHNLADIEKKQSLYQI